MSDSAGFRPDRKYSVAALSREMGRVFPNSSTPSPLMARATVRARFWSGPQRLYFVLVPGMEMVPKFVLVGLKSTVSPAAEAAPIAVAPAANHVLVISAAALRATQGVPLPRTGRVSGRITPRGSTTRHRSCGVEARRPGA